MLGNFEDIIARLEKQKIAIDQAISALREFDESDVTESAAPKTVRHAKAVKKAAAKKRVMSEEGRQRIAEASRKRWAAVRKAATKGARKAA